MRTKSRARVATDRAKGIRPRKGAAPKVYAGTLMPAGAFSMKPMRLLDTFSPYVRRATAPQIGDDMRRKFALRGQRDLELSKAYTQAEVEAIMSKYGPL